MNRILPLEKWARAIKIIAANGGPLGSLLKLWKMDTLKLGKCVGEDTFGNKYYESYYYPIGRSRWVEYNPNFNWDYDATQITAEWFGWIHYKTDYLPDEDPAKIGLNSCSWAHCWLQPHEEINTGTELAFYPYSTVRQHMSTWDGKTICDRQPTLARRPKRPESMSWKVLGISA